MNGGNRSVEHRLTIEEYPSRPAQRPDLANPPRELSQASEAALAVDVWRSARNAIRARLSEVNASGTLDVSTVVGTPKNAMEWVAALDYLYLTLKHGHDCRAVLERELQVAQAALATVRAELLNTRLEERRARRLAEQDGLTMLPNRNYFEARVRKALRQAASEHRTLAVLYLDLDGFKSINDTHGHAVGDELLRIVAARLAHAMRAEDVVSRIGGDEFACLLAGFSNRARLANLARKLAEAVSAPCRLGALKLQAPTSIGIAIYPADGETVERLMTHADAAMYHAKRSRGGFAFFDRSGMHDVLGAKWDTVPTRG